MFEFELKLELGKYFDFEFEPKTRTQLDWKFQVQNLHWLIWCINHHLVVSLYK